MYKSVMDIVSIMLLLQQNLNILTKKNQELMELFCRNGK